MRQIFTHIEKLDFEVFAGLLVMSLNLDHIINEFEYLMDTLETMMDDEFFTSFGYHPETGDPLKPITEYMIRKYICDTFK